MSNKGLLTSDEQKKTKDRWQKLMHLLMQLRKVCNHPFMFPEAEENPEVTDEKIVLESGKMVFLHCLLLRIRRSDVLGMPSPNC